MSIRALTVSWNNHSCQIKVGLQGNLIGAIIWRKKNALIECIHCLCQERGGLHTADDWKELPSKPFRRDLKTLHTPRWEPLRCYFLNYLGGGLWRTLVSSWFSPKSIFSLGGAQNNMMTVQLMHHCCLVSAWNATVALAEGASVLGQGKRWSQQTGKIPSVPGSVPAPFSLPLSLSLSPWTVLDDSLL